MILNMCCGCIENLELLLNESLGVSCSSQGSTVGWYFQFDRSQLWTVRGTLLKLFI